jgi:hypothetical protein
MTAWRQSCGACCRTRSCRRICERRTVGRKPCGRNGAMMRAPLRPGAIVLPGWLDGADAGCDTPADRQMYDHLRDGNYEAWRNYAATAVEDSGQQEILNWMCLVGALSALGRKTAGDRVRRHMDFQFIEDVPDCVAWLRPRCLSTRINCVGLPRIYRILNIVVETVLNRGASRNAGTLIHRRAEVRRWGLQPKRPVHRMLPRKATSHAN